MAVSPNSWGDFGDRSMARIWSVTDWARTSLGLASSEGFASLARHSAALSFLPQAS